MPDSVEGRLGRLERDMARLDQQVGDLAADVERIMPLAVAVSRVELMVGAAKEDLEETRSDLKVVNQNVKDVVRRLDDDAKDRERGRDARRKEDRATRITLWVAAIAAAAALLSALIGALAVSLH